MIHANGNPVRDNITARLIAGVLSAVVFALVMAGSAMALVTPDLSQKGSVSLTLIDKTTDKAIPGGELEVIRVAEVVVDNGFKLKPTGAFDDASFTYDLSTDEQLASPELAKAIDTFAQAHAASITDAQKYTVRIGQDGAARLTDLSLGLYLIRQTVPAAGYNAVNSFLVTVPMSVKDEAGEVISYIYDVDATPKPQKVSPVPEEPTTPEPATRPEDPKLPQTGQLWWPVWVLLACGVASMIAGAILILYRSRINQNKQDEAK